MPSAAPDRRDRACFRRCRWAGWEAHIRMPWLASLRDRARDGLDIDQERLVFGSLDVGIADIGGERIRSETLSRNPHEPPMQGYADDVHRLAIAGERGDPLRYHRLGLDRSTVRPHPHPAARGDALLLRQLVADLDEELWLQGRIDTIVLGPEMEVLGQPIRGRRIGEV